MHKNQSRPSPRQRTIHNSPAIKGCVELNLSDDQVRRLNAKSAKVSAKDAKEYFFASLCENLCVLCVQIMSDYFRAIIIRPAARTHFRREISDHPGRRLCAVYSDVKVATR